ncbi:DUF11 domain-containing protein [Aquisediminimonas sediminicola]|uniref:DUF11 domain-containing protein n=1 Tax=Alteraquisediminimonas sediminicola TaxID=2676787 RepID=UPI001C8DC447|nr:DUF11 domain-containing protein [Aquisediminimonas sediminicola]
MSKYAFIKHVRLCGLVATALTAVHSVSAVAAGVSAGTQIQSTATATYTAGSMSGSVQSNTVTVKVDELLDVAVTGLSGASTTIGSNPVILTYAVTNTGNGFEAFNINVDPAVAGNQFDAVVQTIAIDTNGNNAYDSGVDQVLTNNTATPAIAPDGVLRIFVVVGLPATAHDLETSSVRLTAEAVTGSGSPGTTFTGQGANGSDAVVGASGAQAFGSNDLVASLATVTLTKSASIVDPFGGAQPVPGAIVTYIITASVAGTGQAEGLDIADVIPTGTTYQNSTLKLDGASLSDAADGDAGDASASGINVSLGNITGGSDKTVKFDVKIN